MLTSSDTVPVCTHLCRYVNDALKFDILTYSAIVHSLCDVC